MKLFYNSISLIKSFILNFINDKSGAFIVYAAIAIPAIIAGTYAVVDSSFTNARVSNLYNIAYAACGVEDALSDDKSLDEVEEYIRRNIISNLKEANFKLDDSSINLKRIIEKNKWIISISSTVKVISTDPTDLSKRNISVVLDCSYGFVEAKLKSGLKEMEERKKRIPDPQTPEPETVDPEPFINVNVDGEDNGDVIINSCNGKIQLEDMIVDQTISSEQNDHPGQAPEGTGFINLRKNDCASILELKSEITPGFYVLAFWALTQNQQYYDFNDEEYKYIDYGSHLEVCLSENNDARKSCSIIHEIPSHKPLHVWTLQLVRVEFKGQGKMNTTIIFRDKTNSTDFGTYLDGITLHRVNEKMTTKELLDHFYRPPVQTENADVKGPNNNLVSTVKQNEKVSNSKHPFLNWCESIGNDAKAWGCSKWPSFDGHKAAVDFCFKYPKVSMCEYFGSRLKQDMFKADGSNYCKFFTPYQLTEYDHEINYGSAIPKNLFCDEEGNWTANSASLLHCFKYPLSSYCMTNGVVLSKKDRKLLCSGLKKDRPQSCNKPGIPPDNYGLLSVLNYLDATDTKFNKIKSGAGSNGRIYWDGSTEHNINKSRKPLFVVYEGNLCKKNNSKLELGFYHNLDISNKLSEHNLGYFTDFRNDNETFNYDTSSYVNYGETNDKGLKNSLDLISSRISKIEIPSNLAIIHNIYDEQIKPVNGDNNIFNSYNLVIRNYDYYVQDKSVAHSDLDSSQFKNTIPYASQASVDIYDLLSRTTGMDYRKKISQEWQTDGFAHLARAENVFRNDELLKIFPNYDSLALRKRITVNNSGEPQRYIICFSIGKGSNEFYGDRKSEIAFGGNNSTSADKIYLDQEPYNFWVKLENEPNKGKIFSQFYLNSQTHFPRANKWYDFSAVFFIPEKNIPNKGKYDVYLTLEHKSPSAQNKLDKRMHKKDPRYETRGPLIDSFYFSKIPYNEGKGNDE